MLKCTAFILLVIATLTHHVLAERAHSNQHPDADTEDNEFAQFEEFDDDDQDDDDDGEVADFPEHAAEQDERDSTAPANESEDEDDDEEDASVEDEDDEFEHFSDEEEFEGFDKEKPAAKPSKEKPPDLKITKIPLHLRTNWDSFVMEMIMLTGLAAYFLNFLAGKTKNHRLAQGWFNAHKELLESHFALVGDDGSGKEPVSGEFVKESENVYAMWCSGRVCVEGMLTELKLLKRQDLINCITRMFKPAGDQIVVTVNMERMDKFVFACGTKKSIQKMQKDISDLSQFCMDRKSIDKYDLPPNFQILSEIGEATASILDKKVCQVISKYEGVVEYFHFSDQYSGVKQQEDTQPTKMPDAKSVLIFCFNVPGKGNTTVTDMENMKALFQLVFYCIEKISKMALSKESKNKAERNRQKAEETFLKAAHSQRQEASQARREEKRRQEKEKIMKEEDPDKARKLEERESRRDAKRKQPKMKMMKS